MKMISLTTNNFFYIIRDKRNGMLYGGSKCGRNANPKTFMTKKGYKTSSKIVKEIIKQYGLEVFEIVKIIIREDAGVYEARFLKKVNAKFNKKFYNMHNSGSTFSSSDFKATMIKKHGVSNALHLSWVKEKAKKTTLERYGVENPMQCNTTKKKRKDTMVSRFGVEQLMQIEEYKEKISEKISQTMFNEEWREKVGNDAWKRSSETKQNTINENGLNIYRQVGKKSSDTKRNSVDKNGLNIHQQTALKSAKTTKLNGLLSGGNNPKAKPVIINGKFFEFLGKAVKELGISRAKLRQKINNNEEGYRWAR